MIARMSLEPWFSGWNYHVMEFLFRVIPHKTGIDAVFEFVNRQRLVSTWVYAVFFYLFWRIDDSQTVLRRSRLLQIVIAFGIATTITLGVRPWISWPSPGLSPTFRLLYPKYFWGNGNPNSFPSHSTLTYFLVAMGFWPLSRRISMVLSILLFPLIILPRIYVGGHYPIDVVASLVLAVSTLALVWQWRVPTVIANALSPQAPRPTLREVLFILWVFELAQEFGGIQGIIAGLRRIM